MLRLGQVKKVCEEFAFVPREPIDVEDVCENKYWYMFLLYHQAHTDLAFAVVQINMILL